jgi:hypothetical protein
MAVAIIMEFNGATLEQYNEINRKMGLTPGGPGPAGSISHWAAMMDGKLQVTDVWESREQFDAFARDTLGPLSVEVGFPGPPKITFHDVHNYFTEGNRA